MVCPEAGRMRTALGCGHGVAVGLDEPVAAGCPVDRPFHGAGNLELVGEVDLSGKGFVGIGRGAVEGFIEVIGQAAWEFERGLVGCVAVGERRAPADLDAREQVGLGAGQLEEAGGFELERAENGRVGVEGDGGAAPVGGRADLFELGGGEAFGEFHGVKLAVAGDLDTQMVGEEVDDRGADAVQAAGGFIILAREFAAGIEGAEDDFER